MSYIFPTTLFKFLSQNLKKLSQGLILKISKEKISFFPVSMSNSFFFSFSMIKRSQKEGKYLIKNFFELFPLEKEDLFFELELTTKCLLKFKEKNIVLPLSTLEAPLKEPSLTKNYQVYELALPKYLLLPKKKFTHAILKFDSFLDLTYFSQKTRGLLQYKVPTKLFFPSFKKSGPFLLKIKEKLLHFFFTALEFFKQGKGLKIKSQEYMFIDFTQDAFCFKLILFSDPL